MKKLFKLSEQVAKVEADRDYLLTVIFSLLAVARDVSGQMSPAIASELRKAVAYVGAR